MDACRRDSRIEEVLSLDGLSLARSFDDYDTEEIDAERENYYVTKS